MICGNSIAAIHSQQEYSSTIHLGFLHLENSLILVV